MSARILRRSAVVLAGLVVAAVILTASVVVAEAFSPILPAPDGPPSFGPMPASTAPPAPITPDVSTAVPAHLRGPR